MVLRLDFSEISDERMHKFNPGFFLSGVQYHQPSTGTGGTSADLRERIYRIGGFDSEDIDIETMNIIMGF